MAPHHPNWKPDPDYNPLGNPEDNHRQAVRIKLDRINARLASIRLSLILGLVGLDGILVLLAILVFR